MRFAPLFHNRPRLFAGLLIGFAVGFLLPGSLAPKLRGVIAWDTAAIAYLAMALLTIGREKSIEALKARAAREDQSRWLILVLMSVASFVSLIAIATLLGTTKGLDPTTAKLHLCVGALTILASWSLIHVLFAVHYAHEYYGDSDLSPEIYAAKGGLEFPGKKDPIFSDFLYYSFVVGMTCQVSDVQITASAIRRVTLGHGILAFFFNTFILALSVNIAASLVS